jgi:pyruvate dehydrogenase (quinone)
MGPAVPYAIAAKFAHPTRPVIALVGDGSMQMNGINGLVTIAHVWKRWQDPRLVVLVLNNGDLNQVTWEQRAMAGDPKFADSQDLPEFPYAAYAELLGLRGIKVNRPEDIGRAWDLALSSGLPTVLEVVTDPDVPPLPPYLSRKQARAFASAILKRDEDSIGIIKAAVKEWWDGAFQPGGK